MAADNATPKVSRDADRGADATAPVDSGGVATLERGTYEVLRDRLVEHAGELRRRAEALNARRIEAFGGSEMAVLGNQRIRTENNCVPRDIRAVGDTLLFAYNVFIGLKTETRVDDVFSLHRFSQTDDGFAFDPVSADDDANFLGEEDFVRDFHELYKYYKDTHLLQLRRLDGRLLMVFQTGAAVTDIKVLRWGLDAAGRMPPAGGYLDNRGERDHVFPPSHDFEWTATTRDDHVAGRHPHVSVLDKVFVETVGGDLTVKVEDNTEDGLGIYREPVDEPDQTLDDAEVHYAEVGPLILLRALPYNETDWRYLVFNTRTQSVDRIDAIGQACLLLPEDHGLIYPGGYYLESGETKTFEGDVDDMEFLHVVRSPNGEDVLYIFHERREGRSILLPYNMIRKEVLSPIHCHGYSLFDDGRLVVFRAHEEATRVHPMQIWQTPFVSDEHAAGAPQTGGYLDKVGNADLVRGISDALSIVHAAVDREPSRQIYDDLVATTVRVTDAYYWLGDEDAGDLAAPIAELRGTAELIVDEYEKVLTLRRQAEEGVAAAEDDATELFRELRASELDSVERFVDGLDRLRRQRGHLIGLRDVRYVDGARLDALEAELVKELDELSGRTIEFLLGEGALDPYEERIAELTAAIDDIDKTPQASELDEDFGRVGHGLELLTEIVGGLEIDDPTARTTILERISEVLGGLNRGRALLAARRKELLSEEGEAEFGAQIRLFGQSFSGALALADTPEKCDRQLAKLMVQLEDLESRFGELDPFLEQIATQREDVYEAFSSKKQTLLDERQRRANRLVEAAKRILDGIARRGAAVEDLDALNTYFVGDPMVAKVRDIAGQLRALDDSVRADELESRLAAARDDAARALRDRQDLFEAGGEVITLGRHRFSVNTQPFDLTMVPAGGDEPRMAYYLTGTDYHEPVDDPRFDETRDYWNQLLVSETPEVYRGEYLATAMLFDAEIGAGGLTLAALNDAARDADELVAAVRGYAAERYDEGYERGLHDQDAARILGRLLALHATAGVLRFPPRARAMGCLFWAFAGEETERATLERRARSLARLRDAFAHSPAIDELQADLSAAVAGFAEHHELHLHADDARLAGAYLFEELAGQPRPFTTSAEATRLVDAFLGHLEGEGRRQVEEDLAELADHLAERFELAEAWLRAFVAGAKDAEGDTEGDGVAALAPAVEEAAVVLITARRLERQTSSALTSARVEGLLGQHPRIVDRAMALRLDEVLARLGHFRGHRVPGFRRFQELRHEILDEKRRDLRLDEYQPRVMSAFVRNRLIDEVYLPLIGSNLAKQMGTTGEGKRTDQMGLLLLVSPPGYGKTTLMEYVANRLGLVFVKVNGPSLGHAVRSIDPAEAPNATARQEVAKINFALEMGNNVLLYLDDIQHTHSELLQKFISMCDAQRRMEGVWNGRTRTYDLRGKRFAVCMAGNPYTEAGEKFQIPDMLANRADTYNLGDILEGRDEQFALSYLENSLTSNPVLAQLTTRDPEDVYRLVRMAGGEALQADQLAHPYSAVELEEILSVLRKLIRVQQVLLRVNLEYIASAAQDDAFRTEPRFQLQGSYRNMNKLAEKIVPVMNDAELEALLDDHYASESQTLTSGAESNLLKLAEMRGRLTDEQAERWEEIRRGFARRQTMGGAEEDPAVRMLGQLAVVGERLGDIHGAVAAAAEASAARADADAEKAAAAAKAEKTDGDSAASSATVALLGDYLKKLQANLQALAKLARKAPPTPAPLIDEKALAAIGDRLGEVLGRLGEAAAARPAVAAEPQPAVGGTDLTPYLDRLDATLTTLAEAPRGNVVQTLDPGVFELLADMVTLVGDSLLPLVQSIGRRIKNTEAASDRALVDLFDRSLKNLDQLKGLAAALMRIDTRKERGGSS